MEITPIEVLIGAASAAALFCDYLRRRAAGPVGASTMKPQAAAAPVMTEAPEQPVRPVAAASTAVEMQQTLTAVRRQRSAQQGSAHAPAEASKFSAESFEMNPRKALAEWLDQRAAARASQKRAPIPEFAPPAPAAPVEAEMIAAPEPALVEAAPESAPLITELPEPAEIHAEIAAAAVAGVGPDAMDEPREEIRTILRRALDRRSAFDSPHAEDAPAQTPAEEAVIPPPPPATEPAPRPVEIDEDVIKMLERETPSASRSFADLWNAMTPSACEKQHPKFELIRGAAASSPGPDVFLPAGMHEISLLSRAIASGKRFTGVVMSVGVTDNDGRSSSDHDLMRSIGIFIGSLLRDGEFACRRGHDEFLIVCPDPRGAEAHMRLTAISEQLWDYQLRNAHRFSLVFTWGSAEARHESLAEAVAEASARMSETRRTRRVVSVDLLRPPRVAAM